MAEAILQQLARSSIEAVGSFLESETTTTRLMSNELGAYCARSPVAGWRVMLPLPSGARRADVLVRADFPWSPPLVALVDRPPFLDWTHVEKDGILCLLGSEASVDGRNPVGVARYLLLEAANLVEQLATGNLTEDFRHEFQSYWSWGAVNSDLSAVSLCRPSGLSRKIRCWTGKHTMLLADDDETIRRWLANRGRDQTLPPPTTASAILASISQPPLPNEYPGDGASLVRFLGNTAPEAIDLLQDLMLAGSGDAIVALCAATERGSTLATVVVPRPVPRTAPGYRGPNPLLKGFRPGRVPASTAIQRFASGNTTLRMKTDRADAAWIHGRDQAAGFDELRDAHVAFVGCGSLGSPAIRLLAQAGVGRITIIDPGRLDWPNVGRHALGAGNVGSYKATAMADLVRRDFPHIEAAEPIALRVEELLLANDARLASADVIVSTTGNWSSNAALNDWAAHTDMGKRLVIGWLEAHACAGQAVVLLPPDGCVHCGFDGTGVPKFRVTEWSEETLLQEPACGASFQPYGPIDASHVSTLVAETALDVLLGEISSPTHRMWGARKSFLTRSGGRWTAEWLALAPHAAQGGTVLQRPWPVASECVSCRRNLAA